MRQGLYFRSGGSCDCRSCSSLPVSATSANSASKRVSATVLALSFSKLPRSPVLRSLLSFASRPPLQSVGFKGSEVAGLPDQKVGSAWITARPEIGSLCAGCRWIVRTGLRTARHREDPPTPNRAAIWATCMSAILTLRGDPGSSSAAKVKTLFTSFSVTCQTPVRFPFTPCATFRAYGPTTITTYHSVSQRRLQNSAAHPGTRRAP